MWYKEGTILSSDEIGMYEVLCYIVNTPYNKHFKTIAVVDCEYNEANDCKEILEFLVCYI